MSVYASNNLMKGIKKYSNAGGALFGGIIANSINNPYQKAIIDDFVDKTGTGVVEYVPRSITVTSSELSGRTTIEAAPNTAQAEVYRSLARKIAAHTQSKVPTPLETEELREWSASWADQLLAIEAGEVRGERASI